MSLIIFLVVLFVSPRVILCALKGREMAAYIFGIFLMTYLSYTKSEKCVPERSFNEFQEVVKQQFKELENENVKLKEKLLDLESKIEFYEGRRQEFSADRDSVDVTDLASDERLKDVNVRDIHRIEAAAENDEISGKWKRQGSENVAFYAYLSGKRCYGSHETFIFDVEETDVGNGYNAQDGIFDVPVTGVYVFSITLVPDYFRYVQAEIIINGSVKGIIFADSDEIHDIHPASTSIVVHVNTGDHVYVRRGKSGNCEVISDTTHARTTFSGWLLF